MDEFLLLKIKGLYTSIKGRSVSKKVKCATFEEFSEWYIKQERICYYCGIEEKHLRSVKCKSVLRFKLEVERLEPLHGYVVDNMRLVCHICNRTKSNFFNAQEMSAIATLFIRPKYQNYRLLAIDQYQDKILRFKESQNEENSEHETAKTALNTIKEFLNNKNNGQEFTYETINKLLGWKLGRTKKWMQYLLHVKSIKYCRKSTGGKNKKSYFKINNDSELSKSLN